MLVGHLVHLIVVYGVAILVIILALEAAREGVAQHVVITVLGLAGGSVDWIVLVVQVHAQVVVQIPVVQMDVRAAFLCVLQDVMQIVLVPVV